jgi:hypothetical protein
MSIPLAGVSPVRAASSPIVKFASVAIGPVSDGRWLWRSRRYGRHRCCYAFDCRYDVAKAARAAWIPDLTGASARRNVLTNPFDRRRASVGFDLRANRLFGLAETVADLATTEGLLLPDADPHVPRGKPHVVGPEVDDVAVRIGTEPVLTW